MHIFLNSYHF